MKLLFGLAVSVGLAQGPSVAPSRPARVVLAGAIPSEAVPLMGDANYLGLGDEATRLGSWMRDHPSPFSIDWSGQSIEDKGGARLPISVAMRVTLTRLTQWYGLAASAANPITLEQLRAGALSMASIGRIQKVFERVIKRGVRVGEKWLSPESGGEATIDSELRLIEAEDPRWSTIERLARVAREPQAVALLYETERDAITPLDTHALIRLSLERLKLGSRGAEAEVRRAVDTVVENMASTYAHDPAEQFALIASHDWTGRYVGRWHIHPPHDGNGAWMAGEPPSFEDMQNAVEAGQYLTVVFQPDGFDLYDAAALGDERRVDLSLMKVIHYRSPSWRAHFQRLKQNVGAAR